MFSFYIRLAQPPNESIPSLTVRHTGPGVSLGSLQSVTRRTDNRSPRDDLFLNIDKITTPRQQKAVLEHNPGFLPNFQSARTLRTPDFRIITTHQNRCQTLFLKIPPPRTPNILPQNQHLESPQQLADKRVASIRVTHHPLFDRFPFR